MRFLTELLAVIAVCTLTLAQTNPTVWESIPGKQPAYERLSSF